MGAETVNLAQTSGIELVTAPWISKDGVSDADLMRAARDMYEALDELLKSMGPSDSSPRKYLARMKACKAIAKARGKS
jgi:hypothetical protein